VGIHGSPCSKVLSTQITPPSPNGAAIATFNAVIAGDPRVEQVLLPLRDGMTLIRRA
jgi:caffeoyl-CoA O-methyltransferase